MSSQHSKQARIVGAGRWGRVVGAGLGLVLALAVLPLAAVGAQQAHGNPCAGSAPPAGFVDVAAGNAHRDSIDCIALLGIGRGVTETRYEPAGVVRRDQMAGFLARVLDAAGFALPAGMSFFTDTGGNVHRTDIARLNAAGIVQGVNPLTYDPAGQVTRAQMASFMVRTAEFALSQNLAAPSAPFTDTAGSVHRANVDAAYAAGLVLGRTATTFEPSAPTRRDQMASFLSRLVDFIWLEELPAPVAPSIELDMEEIEAGGVLTGRVTGDDIESLQVDGCGLIGQDVELAPDGSFSILIPATTLGDCELSFTVSTTSPTGATAAAQVFTIKVTIKVLPHPVSSGPSPVPTPTLPPVPGIGGIANPGNLTDAPELLAVNLQQEFTDTVRFGFRFDQSVAPDGLPPWMFFLNMWDGSRLQGISAIRDDSGVGGGRADTVRVVFPKAPIITPDLQTHSDFLLCWIPLLDACSTLNWASLASTGNYLTHAGATAPGSSTLTWKSATTASVAYSAVRSVSDDLLVNPEGSAPLQSVTLPAGRSQFPNLTGVTGWIDSNTHPNGWENSTLFVFDRKLTDEEGANALSDAAGTDSGFGVILRGAGLDTTQSAGGYVVRGFRVAHPAATATTGWAHWPDNPDRLRVFFADAVLNAPHATNYVTPGVIADAARGYVLKDVWNPTLAGLGGGHVTTTSIKATERPDLVSVTPHATDPDKAVFRFSEPVYNPDKVGGPDPGSAAHRIWSAAGAAAFHAYHYNGLRSAAIAAERPLGADARDVEVEFAPGVLSPSVVGYAVDGWTGTGGLLGDFAPGDPHGAAVRSTGNGTLNEPQAIGVARTFSGGRTLAPNLERVEITTTGTDAATGVVTEYTVHYIFDRRLSDVDVTNTTFTLYDQNGVRRTSGCALGGCTFSPTGARNEVRILASAASGGFSLLGGGNAKAGGVELAVVNIDPGHPVIGGLPLPLAVPATAGHVWDTAVGGGPLVNYETTRRVVKR